MFVLYNVISRFIRAAHDQLHVTFAVAGFLVWDFGCVLANLVIPSRRRGALFSKPDQLGHGGIWPQYIPPTDDDSRSPCPGLNALCNHGILPRDGRNITFREMSKKVQEVYNFAPTFARFVPWYAAQQLHRSWSTDSLDLSDLSSHNMIEHDASLIRHDASLQTDQSKPAHDLIDELLGIPIQQERKHLTVSDIARFSTMRRAHSRITNRQHSLAVSQKLFGSANASTLLSVFGGDVNVLTSVLKEERLPEGFEPACRKPYGLTMAAFQTTTLAIEAQTEEPSLRVYCGKGSGSPTVGSRIQSEKGEW